MTSFSRPPAGYLIFGSFLSGWQLANWYRLVSITPPKIHPIAALLQGAISYGASYSLSYLLHQVYKPERELNTLEKGLYVAFITLLSALIANSTVNYLNIHYLQLNRINEKLIAVKPIAFRDSLLIDITTRLGCFLIRGIK